MRLLLFNHNFIFFNKLKKIKKENNKLYINKMLLDGFEHRRVFNCSCSASSISTWYAPVFLICPTLHPTHNTAQSSSFLGNENQLMSWRLSVGISKWQKQLFRDLKPKYIPFRLKRKRSDNRFESCQTTNKTKSFWGTPECLAPETSNSLSNSILSLGSILVI